MDVNWPACDLLRHYSYFEVDATSSHVAGEPDSPPAVHARLPLSRLLEEELVIPKYRRCEVGLYPYSQRIQFPGT